MEPQQLIDEVRQHLELAEIFVLDQQPIQHGVRLSLNNSSIVTIYKTGKVLVQGKAQDVTNRALTDFVTAPISKAEAESITPAMQRAEGLPFGAGWARCSSCSGVLVESWQRCPWCGAVSGLSDLQRRCEACRERLADAWDFCPECGCQADLEA